MSMMVLPGAGVAPAMGRCRRFCRWMCMSRNAGQQLALRLIAGHAGGQGGAGGVNGGDLAVFDLQCTAVRVPITVSPSYSKPSSSRTSLRQ